MNDSTILVDFQGTVRLFPLPNLVLFPQVVQGLHIFEPRYRELITDSLSSDQLVALVLLKAGWEENYEAAPAIESIACLGRIMWHEKMSDGRFNIRLRGLTRIRILEEIPTNKPYRVSRAELLPDLSTKNLDALRENRRALAKAVLPLFEEGPTRQQFQELFDGEMPLGHVCDVLSYALPLSLELKQQLLAEMHSERRAATIVDSLRMSAARAKQPFPPIFSAN